ncbi:MULTISPECIES: NADPH:quinone oxidoreductase family protein [unclassified Aeromicrobium]|jgi:NADPH2:quinone reductase|uniref:NADPH:quinone oxidoreductase family protein n=1 Tax=unclassified Aeromicrobium TaxID=2633570 RepID=UPI0006F68155|nr:MULTISPECIES: NADPH:quinone oxidoreductase family protein [unclassified Aeromicrobium]KQO42744.1 NADPH:quinone oxidoreductase [Aeromicrobium sp. Leaf245]KQP26738.1 NADPH:quinone oxidoreductase [Aeromicrobium sp. Leaf272]KQP77853.1 NADPH:quinone oxidoreductase [Aeromicrobium sp. Leaf289]KQP83490.1 NADPH:quinone oxidoreductase [Aeromicrobium sp. Leaf291]
MRAVQITTLDGPSAVEVTELPDPTAADGQVLVRVRAAGVSFPEVLQTRGLYQLKPELPFVPGSEVAGEVVTAPEGSGFSPGDRVAGFCMLGGFAEYAVTQPDMTFHLPDAVSFEQGASVPLNYLTAYFALVERGRIAPGERVLVHGAAGGVGTASIQVAKAFGAGHVIAVTSTAEKGAVAIDAGADEFVLADGFLDAVKASGKVDLVVDPVGGDRFTDSLRSLREDGRLLVIGFTAGDIPEVKVNRLLLNNLSVVGVGWGAYALARPGHVAQEWAAIAPHLESGALTPPIGATFGLDEAAQALATIDERRATGKVLLTP